MPTVLCCCFFHNAKAVSQQALRCALYYNKEMSLCHASDFGSCLRGIMLHGEWRSDQIYRIKPAGSRENALALSGFQMKQPVNWMQNRNGK